MISVRRFSSRCRPSRQCSSCKARAEHPGTVCLIDDTEGAAVTGSRRLLSRSGRILVKQALQPLYAYSSTTMNVVRCSETTKSSSTPAMTDGLVADNLCLGLSKRKSPDQP